ncbi:conserved protein of unknown function [Pararobbsia alpina]|uniref:hypothetical protein n=1 Tax=Pararobbsia alpina TaxID=621374 RepID=UPI0039A413A2
MNDAASRCPSPGLVSIKTLRSLVCPRLYQETVLHVAQQSETDSADAEHRIIECLRYLYLVSAHPASLRGQFLPVEQEIDDVWHYLILQTREYKTLCEERLPGRFFIHHRSLPYGEHRQEATREQRIEAALRWLPLYRDTFGAMDEHALPYWTMAKFLRGQMGLSLQQIADLDR